MKTIFDILNDYYNSNDAFKSAFRSNPSFKNNEVHFVRSKIKKDLSTIQKMIVFQFMNALENAKDI